MIAKKTLVFSSAIHFELESCAQHLESLVSCFRLTIKVPLTPPSKMHFKCKLGLPVTGKKQILKSTHIWQQASGLSVSPSANVMAKSSAKALRRVCISK